MKEVDPTAIKVKKKFRSSVVSRSLPAVAVKRVDVPQSKKKFTTPITREHPQR